MTNTARLYRRGKWKQDEDGSESVEDVWEIRMDSETATITDVLSVSGLPAKNDPHAEKTAAKLVDHDCDHDDEVLNVWYYSARYSTRQQFKEDDNPLSQRTKGGMRSSFKDVPAFYDARGYPLVNTAGDLYEGLTRRRRTRTIPVTHNFDEIPNWFFELAETTNASAVTIHGQSYPAGTCLLTDIEMPDEPSRGKNGEEYWPITYNVIIDPDGHYIILPNKGPNELVYQVRASSTAAWTDATKATYDAKTPTTDRQIIKRKIATEDQQEVPSEIWLDANGQAQRVVTFQTSQIGTGAMTAGDETLTLAAAGFNTTTHKGALVKVYGAGLRGRPLIARIASVTSTTVAELESKALTTVASGVVMVSGAIVQQFVMLDLADWSTVPLPNNGPGV